MKNVNIVGCSMGDINGITISAKNVLSESELIIGSSRILDTLSFVKGKKIDSKSANEMIEIIKKESSENISIAVSGDTGFFSMAKVINDKIIENNLDVQVDFICGISSLSYFLNALKISYTNCQTISLHGRKISVLNTVLHNQKTFGITSSGEDMQYVFDCLIKGGFGDTPIFVGENLSYNDEMITKGTPNSLKDIEFGSLCVFLVLNKNSKGYISISDDDFVRGKSPMTKSDIRALSIIKLGINKNSVVYDIGAGTGSVCCEIAVNYPMSKVFAYEKNSDAIDILKENIQKFDCKNIALFEGTAPDVFLYEEPADFAFIGGSGGNLKDMLNVLRTKNPQVKICITAISLQTLEQILEYIKENNIQNYEISQHSSAFTKKIAKYDMLMANNPVFIVVLGGN